VIVPPPESTVLLETDRLTLRRFTVEDADLLVELDSDPAVMRYITGGVTTSREEIETDFLPAFLRYYERFDGYGFWAAIEKATGRFVGWFHLRPAPGAPEDVPELGYRLPRDAWGNGYATEGSQALVDAAFSRFAASRVVAETMVVNTASRRVMEKVGMSVSRVFHQDWPHPIEGDEHGDVEYAIDRAQWEK
jgi:RimJ/RimL family protein N-acetyltransferase